MLMNITVIRDINNDHLNKQVSHFILHFINEKFNTSQDLWLCSVQNRIAQIHIQSLCILLKCVVPGNLQQNNVLDKCTALHYLNNKLIIHVTLICSLRNKFIICVTLTCTLFSNVISNSTIQC